MKSRDVMITVSTGCVILAFTFWHSRSSQQPVRTTSIQLPYNGQISSNQGQHPTIEMTFVIDTTGSMGGLLEAAKTKIWSIINHVMQCRSHPDVRVGLVAYRDHQDQYVTKAFPLSSNLDSVYAELMQYKADGGGDEPEDVRQGLADGLRKVGWSQKRAGLSQMIFLVGDAPPHDDYVNEPSCIITAQEAIAKGIFVNTIQCGNSPDCQRAWNLISDAGRGRFTAIAENGGVVAVSTPYDRDLASLGSHISDTYVAYGGSGLGGGTAGATAFRATKAAAEKDTDRSIAAAAPIEAQASRASNKAINSSNFDGDLIEDAAKGKVNINGLKTEDLPDGMQRLSGEERIAFVQKTTTERESIQRQIMELSKKRDTYISAQNSKGSKGSSGFDFAVNETIKSEAAQAGISL